MFQADGILTGMRKWQTRKPVTIDGEQRYTDWEDVELSGTFKGTWQLRYWSPEGNSGKMRNCLQLTATYDDEERDCPHLRLRRRHHPPLPRLLRQRCRRLGQLPARPSRTRVLKRHLIKSNRKRIK